MLQLLPSHGFHGLHVARVDLWASRDRDGTSDLFVQLRLLIVDRRKNLPFFQTIPLIRYAKEGERPRNCNVRAILELTQDVRLGAVQRVRDEIVVQAIRLVRPVEYLQAQCLGHVAEQRG